MKSCRFWWACVHVKMQVCSSQTVSSFIQHTDPAQHLHLNKWCRISAPVGLRSAATVQLKPHGDKGHLHSFISSSPSNSSFHISSEHLKSLTELQCAIAVVQAIRPLLLTLHWNNEGAQGSHRDPYDLPSRRSPLPHLRLTAARAVAWKRRT